MSHRFSQPLDDGGLAELIKAILSGHEAESQSYLHLVPLRVFDTRSA